jgi:hypothetical protein
VRLPERRSHDDDLDDDVLVERGATLENQLAAISLELDHLAIGIEQERRKLRKSAVKLGFNAIIGSVGIAATPVTFGLSLCLTVAGIVMITWDGMDYAREHARHVPNRRRVRQLGTAADEIADELAAIHATLEARTSGEAPRPRSLEA